MFQAYRIMVGPRFIEGPALAAAMTCRVLPCAVNSIHLAPIMLG